MATGSFILHGSRKKVGNLVTYKRDGVQVVREIATSVANPKTVGQAKQRALFAPVAKFYSPLSVVLEQSFEGLSKSASYSRFLKANLKLARNNGWFLPQGFGWFPLPFLISKGTVQPLRYAVVDDRDSIRIEGTAGIFPEQITTLGGISQIFMSLGYQAGDQVTIIVGKADDPDDGVNANFWPEYFRFIIAPDSTETASFAGVEFHAVSESGLEVRSNDAYVIVAGAVIVSRYQNGIWKRSSSYLELAKKLFDWLHDWLKDERSIASYRDRTGDVQSDIYLNGSTYAGGAASGGSTIHLVDGTSFTPRSLTIVADPNAFAYVSGTIGILNSRRALVQLGDSFLLTKSTKGALPSSIIVADWSLIDGTQPEMKAWLMYNGVEPSVF